MSSTISRLPTRPLTPPFAGYTQDAAAFSKKTAVIRKSLARQNISFHYVSAPHRVEPIGPVEDSDPEKCLGWWKGQHWGSTKEIEKRMFGESLEYLLDVVRKEGPFDGVLGFSQGAAMAALLCARLQTGSTELGLQMPRFGVFVAGFDPTTADTFQPLMESAGRIAVQGSLHISGARDTLVIPDRTRALMNNFFDPATAIWHSHAGGHVVPSTSGDRKVITDFILSFRDGETKVEDEQSEVNGRKLEDEN